MSNWRTILQSGIALFCETVWLYLGVYFLVSVHWNLPLWPQSFAWLMPAGIAYLVNYWLGGRSVPLLWLFLTNVGLLVGLVLPHWTYLYNGQLGYAIVLSMCIAYLYLRSSFFVYKHPTRTQMVLRFEGNIIFYALFILFTYTQADVPVYLHLLFILAALFSLVGMLLSLSGGAETNIETRTVGEAGFLPVLMFLLFGSGVLLSLLLLFPSVRQGLGSIAAKLWAGLTWLGSSLLKGIIWLFALLPEPDSGELLPSEVGPAIQLPEEMTQAYGELPILWILAIVAILVIILVLWISSYFIRNWRPASPARLRRSTLKRTSFWKKIWSLLLAFGRSIIQKWRSRLPSYFALPIYWYFYRVTRWAKKQGLERKGVETPQEFVHRLIEGLSIESELHPLFYRLGEAYSTAYYSGGKTIAMEDFSPLLEYIKKG